MNEPCPWDSRVRNDPAIFIWSVISTILYPIGIPVMLFSCLLYLEVPKLANTAKAEAIFQQMLDLYIKQRDKTVSSRIASYVGGQKADGSNLAVVECRAVDMFSEVSCNGEYDVTSKRLLEWLSTIGITGNEEEEVDELFLQFDEDHNGVLDQDEMLALIRFLDKTNRYVSHELTLRNLDARALSILSDYGVCVCVFVCERERARERASERASESERERSQGGGEERESVCVCALCVFSCIRSTFVHKKMDVCVHAVCGMCRGEHLKARLHFTPTLNLI